MNKKGTIKIAVLGGFIALLFSLILVYPTIVKSYTLGNSFANINFNLTESSADLAYAHAIINFTYSGSLLPSSIDISSLNITQFLPKVYNWVSGSDRFMSDDVLFGYNNSYNISTFIANTTFDTYIITSINGTNTTIQNQTSAGTTILTPAWQWIYNSTKWNTLIKNQEYRLKYEMFYKPSNKLLLVDLIPALNISGTNYNMTQLVWFSSNYQYKRAQTVTPNVALTNFPSAVNGSNGFVLGTEPSQFVWFNDTYTNGANTNYLYYQNFSYYATVNGSENKQLNSEVERGNGTSNNPTSVWDSNFNNVYHMGEPSGSFNDSTANKLNMTAVGTFLYSQNCLFGYCANSSTSGYGDIPLVNFTNYNMTLEAWLKTSSIGIATYQEIMRQNPSSGNPDFLFSFQATGGNISYGLTAGGAYAELHCVINPANYNDNNWHYFVARYNGSAKAIFIDGVEFCETPTTGAIGFGNTGKFCFAGVLSAGICNAEHLDNTLFDEIRISTTDRSSNWINQTYQTAVGANKNILGSQQVSSFGSVSANSTTPSTPYSGTSAQSLFNVTWSNSTAAFSTCLVQSNYTGTETNYTMTQISSNSTATVCGYSANIGATTYTATFYANDTSNNQNSTAKVTATISKGTPTIQLFLNGTQSNKTYTYPQAVNATGIVGNGDTGYTQLLVNGTLTNQLNNGYFDLSSSSWVISNIVGEGACSSSDTSSNYVSNTQSDYNYSAYVSGNAGSNCVLEQNTSISSINLIYNAWLYETGGGYHDVVLTIYNNTNTMGTIDYTDAVEGTHDSLFNGANSSTECTITVPLNTATKISINVSNFLAGNICSTVNYTSAVASSANIIASKLSHYIGSGQTDSWRTYLDSAFLNSSVIINSSIAVGVYNYTLQYPATANYSSSSVTYYATVNKGTPIGLNTYIAGQAVNKTITWMDTANVTANTTQTDCSGCLPTFNLYTQALAGTGTNIWNATQLGSGTYNIVYNTSGNANWTSASNSSLYLIVNKAWNVTSQIDANDTGKFAYDLNKLQSIINYSVTRVNDTSVSLNQSLNVSANYTVNITIAQDVPFSLNTTPFTGLYNISLSLPPQAMIDSNSNSSCTGKYGINSTYYCLQSGAILLNISQLDAGNTWLNYTLNISDSPPFYNSSSFGAITTSTSGVYHTFQSNATYNYTNSTWQYNLSLSTLQAATEYFSVKNAGVYNAYAITDNSNCDTSSPTWQTFTLAGNVWYYCGKNSVTSEYIKVLIPHFSTWNVIAYGSNAIGSGTGSGGGGGGGGGGVVITQITPTSNITNQSISITGTVAAGIGANYLDWLITPINIYGNIGIPPILIGFFVVMAIAYNETRGRKR